VPLANVPGRRCGRLPGDRAADDRVVTRRGPRGGRCRVARGRSGSRRAAIPAAIPGAIAARLDPTEAVNRTELEARLARDGWTAAAWANGPGERYAAHQHGYDTVLVVAEGESGRAAWRGGVQG